jgi:hypothetical protein
VPKHIADTSPMATPADRVDPRDSAGRDPVDDPAIDDPAIDDPAIDDPGVNADADAIPGVAIPPPGRTVVIRPLLVAY